MRQLGLAVQNNHDSHRRFPAVSTKPVTTAIQGSTAAATQAGYSWIVKCLPYMEERTLYDNISNWSLKFTHASGPFFANITQTGGAATATNLHLSTVDLDQVRCPSFAGEPIAYNATAAGNPPPAITGVYNQGATPPYGPTLTNYLALSASHIELISSTSKPTDANGASVPVLEKSMKDMTDGTSKTFIACETKEQNVCAWYDGTTAWAVAYNPYSTPAKKDTVTGFWIKGDAAGVPALNVGPKPDPNVKYLKVGKAGLKVSVDWSWGPSSEHSGGTVNHLVGDGSARGVSEIDADVYMQLITRDEREPAIMPEG